MIWILALLILLVVAFVKLVSLTITTSILQLALQGTALLASVLTGTLVWHRIKARRERS